MFIRFYKSQELCFFNKEEKTMPIKPIDPTTLPKRSKEIQSLLDEYRAIREEMEAHEAELSQLQASQ